MPRGNVATAATLPPEPERRTASGERKIDLKSTARLVATRQSERFRIPDEARPSVPPPSASATLRCPIPESVKQLSVPTPHASFEPVAPKLPIPAGPESAVARAVEPGERAAADEGRAVARARPVDDRTRRVARYVPRARTRTQETANAVALFLVLLGGSVLATRIVVAMVFG